MQIPISTIEKQHYIKEALDHCCNELNIPCVKLKFENSKDPSEYRKLALDHPFYVLRENFVEFYYIYSEPGNPLISEKFDDICSLCLHCLSAGLQIRDCDVIANLWAQKLVECPIPSLQEHINKTVDQTQARDGEVNRMSLFALAKEVSDCLASARRKRLLPVLRSKIIAECDSIVFEATPRIVQSLADSIIGRWRKVSALDDVEYRFDGSTLDTTRKMTDGTLSNATASYESFLKIGRTLWLEVSSSELLSHNLIVTFSRDFCSATVLKGTQAEKITRMDGQSAILVS